MTEYELREKATKTKNEQRQRKEKNSKKTT